MPTLDRRWTDAGPTLGRRWTDVGPTLDRRLLKNRRVCDVPHAPLGSFMEAAQPSPAIHMHFTAPLDATVPLRYQLGPGGRLARRYSHFEVRS